MSIFEFTTQDEVFLKKFGETSYGKDLKRLLHRMRSEVDRSSNIPSNSDYGSQVEGRKLVNELLTSVIDKMSKKEPDSYKNDLGNDEFD